MPHLDRKQLLIIGAGALVLVLLYRWYAGRSAGGGAVDQAVPDGTAGADYSQLAGQQQSDAAALQNQEQGDVQGLSATEAADIADLTAAYSGLSDQLGGLSAQVADLPGPTDISGVTEQLNAVAAGTVQANRTAASALSKAREAAWNAGGHSISYAQHVKDVAAHTPAKTHQAASKQSGSVAASHHGAKPHVTAKPATHSGAASSSHQTSKAGVKPPSGKPKPKPKPKPKARTRVAAGGHRS